MPPRETHRPVYDGQPLEPGEPGETGRPVERARPMPYRRADRHPGDPEGAGGQYGRGLHGLRL